MARAFTPISTTKPGRRRWELVDMLRGIAVLLVLFRHHGASGVLQEVGWLGVDLFFVLSGFLVSGLIFDEYRRAGAFDGVRFLIRRGFKIYPSFYLLIGVSTVLMAVTDRADPLMNYVAELFFFQNYHEGLWTHTWSLGVEEHFYIVLVVSALLVIRYFKVFSLNRLVLYCAALFLLFLFLRVWTNMQEPFEMRSHMFASHLRLDSLLAGVLLAAFQRYRPERFNALFGRRRSMLVLIMIVLLLPILLTDFGSFAMATIGFTGAYLAGAIAVGMAVTAAPTTGRSALHRLLVGPLAWVGSISYTTYLWHLLVLLVVEMATEHTGLQGTVLELAVFLFLSVLVGELTSRILERPALILRERWFPARGRKALP
jgi:peptidoglycan/LPS O-acetylase OafA/YrhL